MENKENEYPKFALVTLGKFTYVFFDGKCISSGLEDAKFYAKDENGELHPTLEMKIDIQNFSFESGKSLDEFLKGIMGFSSQFNQIPPND